jgi:hypothetical protein
MRVGRVRRARDTRGKTVRDRERWRDAAEEKTPEKARRARWCARARTWTLDALRAATEPVKEEAMQAILYVVCVWEWRGVTAEVGNVVFSRTQIFRQL